MTEQAGTSGRSIILVAGSGRSGTSVMSGVLSRLGYVVPKPEVEPDQSNPKGFAESRWVVDFHTRLLASARVETADARPTAWADTASVADDAVTAELRAFLSKQFAKHEHLVIKDPRLIWFLPLWRQVADDMSAAPKFLTMLRHPADVVASKSRYYGAWRGDVSRTAGWVNTMLYTERATRDGARAFVRFEDLLEDWPRVVDGVAGTLGLAPVADATAAQMRAADAFIDPSLLRSSSSWDDLEIPTALRDQAEHVWTLLCRLADKGQSDDSDIAAEVDAARESYVSLYEDAEAIARSSITAASRVAKAPRSAAHAPKGLARRIWHRLPRRWQGAIRSALQSRSS
jgi:hypothetical protein